MPFATLRRAGTLARYFIFRARIPALVLTSVFAGALAPATAHANTPPKIWGKPPAVATQGTLYTFRPGAADADGHRLTFSIVNKPRWMWFSTSTGKLSGLPKWAQRNRTFSNIVIKVSDGRATVALPAFSITVRSSSGNVAPKISGVPASAVAFGSKYWFRPTASDANRDALRFSIAGKPGWATFNSRTGALAGTPTWRQAGTYSGIVISVSDGKATAKLPAFAIKVQSATANRAPTIWGKPVTSAQVGRPYAFKPGAADADGDALKFSVASKPDWARFDTSTGSLYGTPTSADAGRYANVSIRVTDGQANASLAPFTITVGTTAARTVTLTWTKPTRNTDGSWLKDLAGYRVSYGQASRKYTDAVRVGAHATSAVVEGLASGTWYFAIASINAEGVVSEYSGEVKATL